MEEWKYIDGYENYMISNLGRVKSLPRNGTINEERMLKQYKDKDGYMYVALRNESETKKKKVHRLVAMAFLNATKDKNIINHKNHIRDDNRVENLEWCDTTYNNRYSRADIVHKKDLSGNVVITYPSKKECVRQEHISINTLNKVLNTNNIHNGYLWSN